MPKGIYKRTESSRLNMRKAHLGKKMSTLAKLRMSKSHKGKIPYIMTEKTKEKIRLLKKGKPFWKVHPKGMLGKKLSQEHKRKISDSMRGDKSPNWKGGITSINQIIRTGLEYRLWRTSVFERDNYTCIWCGVRSGNGKAVVLNADHIKPFAHYPELRFAIDNGRTLCRECHQTTNTYAGKSTKRR